MLDRIMDKKQITVRERNDCEGETFNYVIRVTKYEQEQIIEKCEKFGDETLSISETNYTNDDIKKINNLSNNLYMSFIALYELSKDALDNWVEFGDCFYKGNGLNKLK